jgi:hypothetical protein
MIPIIAIIPSRMYLPASGGDEFASVEELYKIKFAPLWTN